MGLIYRALNIKNNKSYVGQTINGFEIRKKEHLGIVKNHKTQKKRVKKFHRALLKSPNDFIWEILEDNLSNDILNVKEQYWVQYFDSYNNGYNLTKGGKQTWGYKFSKKSCKKISNFHKALNKKRGPKQHPSWKKHISIMQIKLYWEDLQYDDLQLRELIGLENRAIRRHLVVEFGNNFLYSAPLARKKARSYYKIQQYAKKINFKLLTSMDLFLKGNVKQKIKLQCPTGYVFKMRASAFTGGQCCSIKCPKWHQHSCL